MITSEVVRKNKDKGLTEDQVNDNLYASQVIADESKNANDALFGGIKCRVKVAGSDRQDLNGRMGTLRYWDANEKKFCVGLDTKKAKDCEEHFLSTENVEPIGSVPRTDKNKSDMQSYNVDMTNDFLSQESDSGIGCQFTIDKAAIASIRSAESIPVGLAAFSLEQNKKEKALRKKEAKERRQAQEEEKRMEEEDRKRRAAKKKARKEDERRKEKARREAAAKRELENQLRQQEQERLMMKKGFEKRKKEYDQMKKEAEKKRVMEYIQSMKDEKDPMMKEEFLEFFQEYGDEFERMRDLVKTIHRFFRAKTKGEKLMCREEEDREAAEILGKDIVSVANGFVHCYYLTLILLSLFKGVDPDADERTITVTYRKLALKYRKSFVDVCCSSLV